MIPKVIHYCWFGRGKMPKMANYCIESWKKYLPDYELVLWNEDSFDINSVPYVKEAYESKKYAFVTDYVRLYALYHYGGIYMDTDVEILRSLDDLLHLPGFLGFESDKYLQTGIMVAKKGNFWAKQQLDAYTDRHFIKEDGTLDLTTNVQTMTNIMLQNGIRLDNSHQVYMDCMHIFPFDYFCPKSRSGIITITKNTYCIHHFDGSWQPLKLKLKKRLLHSLFSPKIIDKLVRIKRSLLKKK